MLEEYVSEQDVAEAVEYIEVCLFVDWFVGLFNFISLLENCPRCW
jgi:hypothetical protein